MALFDRYLIVDWSAANTPKRGKDSIWMALCEGVGVAWVRNISTRHEAMALVGAMIEQTRELKQRLFIGFDFAFGWPRGAAAFLPQRDEQKSWQRVWQTMAQQLVDGGDNANNSYDVAAALNRDVFTPCNDGPFWGHPHQHVGRYSGLAMKKSKQAFEHVHEYRHVEKVARGAKSIWQLAYNGTVGRQSMLGMAHLQKLRSTHDVAVWPFETVFDQQLDRPVIVAEIYPSMFATKAADGEIKDETQVRVTAEHFAALDRSDAFRPLLARPEIMDDATALEVIEQEGWIVGAGHRHD